MSGGWLYFGTIIGTVLFFILLIIVGVIVIKVLEELE